MPPTIDTPGASLVPHGKQPAKAEDCQFGHWAGEDPLEKEMANHFSLLAWETPWTGEFGGMQPTESQQSQTRLSH